MATFNSQLERLPGRDYPADFVTDIDTGSIAPGLSEAASRLISARKQQPPILPERRLAACRHGLTLAAPQWTRVHRDTRCVARLLHSEHAAWRFAGLPDPDARSKGLHASKAGRTL